MTSTPGYVPRMLTEDDIDALKLPKPSTLGRIGRFTGVSNATTKPVLHNGVIHLLEKYEITKVEANKPILIEAMKRILRRSEIDRDEYGVSDAENFNAVKVAELLENPNIRKKMRKIFREEDHSEYDGGRRRKTRRRKVRRSTRRRKTSRR